MEPVRIKLYGLITLTKRGYITQLIVGGVLIIILFVIWSITPKTLPPKTEDPAGLLWLVMNLHWILLALIALYSVEAFIVFRRFARAEAQQKANKAKK